MDEPDLPRSARGAPVVALSREDLDLFSVDDLDERVALLKAEISRVEAAKKRKFASRSAADALFGRKPDTDADLGTGVAGLDP